jgi:hypothetical protein
MEAAVIILAGLVAFQFIYGRYRLNKLEDGMINFEAELDYTQDVIDTIRKEQLRVLMNDVRRSKPVKSRKGLGRPVNPNSVRQKKLRGDK